MLLDSNGGGAETVILHHRRKSRYVSMVLVGPLLPTQWDPMWP